LQIYQDIFIFTINSSLFLSGKNSSITNTPKAKISCFCLFKQGNSRIKCQFQILLRPIPQRGITSEVDNPEEFVSLFENGFKGSVQRKLRWVENGVNRSVGASDCGAGHSFIDLFGFHFDFIIFPFPVSTAEFIGEFWINKQSTTIDVAQIVLALYRIRYWR
jgi:hypothetical protein